MSKYTIELNGFSFYMQKQLSHEEMRKLLIHYQKYKDEESKNQLIYANFKLVLSIVKKYNSKSEHLEDLFQVGIIGLIKAIENFDLSYNLKFSTYAVPLILGEVKKYIRDSSSIKIPRSLRDIAYKVIQEKEEYIKVYNKEPTVKELSKKLNLDEYLIVEALSSTLCVSSLSQEIQNDGESTIDLESQLKDTSHDYNEYNMILDLNNAMKELSKHEFDIIKKRYYQGKTQMELANELFVSQAQISRIEKKALMNLKRIMNI